MNWIKIENTEELAEAKAKSFEKPLVIFKHSTRCSISAAALDRIERRWDPAEIGIDAYYVNLIQFRSVSNEISEMFNIRHESRQLLLIKDGECIFDSSHFSISYEEVRKVLEKEALTSKN